MWYHSFNQLNKNNFGDDDILQIPSEFLRIALGILYGDEG